MEKYSDKFLNQYDKLKKSRIGFEFEFYLKDLSYYKTLEMLNQYLAPIKVWGFREYHSNFNPNEDNFKIEPDLSGGSNMVELITGPLPYFTAKYYLVKILNFINKHGYTNDKCSLHYNISFMDDGLNLPSLNVLKFILNFDEDEIYRSYPSRDKNIYSKSIKNIIPYKNYDFYNVPINIIQNNLKIPEDKYYGVNFMYINEKKSNQRIEFRYIGGKNYHKNIGRLIYFMEKFIIQVYDNIKNPEFSNNDISILQDILSDKINYYKNLSNYDNFLVEYPKISIQVDQINTYDVVSSYYPKIYNKISDFIGHSEITDSGIINYVTATQKIEVVDFNFKTIGILKNMDIINCHGEGIFEQCNIVNSEFKNCRITDCEIHQSDILDSKVLKSKVESSLIRNCYFVNGYLNGDMIGGIYRSGELGPFATFDKNVKVIKNVDNFFDTKFDMDDEGDKSDKGVIDFKGIGGLGKK